MKPPGASPSVRVLHLNRRSLSAPRPPGGQQPSKARSSGCSVRCSFARLSRWCGPARARNATRRVFRDANGDAPVLCRSACQNRFPERLPSLSESQRPRRWDALRRPAAPHPPCKLFACVQFLTSDRTRPRGASWAVAGEPRRTGAPGPGWRDGRLPGKTSRAARVTPVGHAAGYLAGGALAVEDDQHALFGRLKAAGGAFGIDDADVRSPKCSVTHRPTHARRSSIYPVLCHVVVRWGGRCQRAPHHPRSNGSSAPPSICSARVRVDLSTPAASSTGTPKLSVNSSAMTSAARSIGRRRRSRRAALAASARPSASSRSRALQPLAFGISSCGPRR